MNSLRLPMDVYPVIRAAVVVREVKIRRAVAKAKQPAKRQEHPKLIERGEFVIYFPLSFLLFSLSHNIRPLHIALPSLKYKPGKISSFSEEQILLPTYQLKIICKISCVSNSHFSSEGEIYRKRETKHKFLYIIFIVIER
mmetsp:Transcript_36815/g.41976  ORF Transcript_36815/g.41976 Transcript_36815/m.41976 type:complete len:140 (-) Transcript_36815:39-458(-)